MASRESGPRRSKRSRRTDTSSSGERQPNGAADEGGRRPADDTDVVLDVPMLNVEELELEVEDLRAHVSARAELADFVSINVGVDIYLDKVKLGVKGVEAQALLRVRLERILGIIERALDAVEDNPDLLTGAVRRTEDEAGDVVETTPHETGEVGEGDGETLGPARDDSGGPVGDTLEDEKNVDGTSEAVEEGGRDRATASDEGERVEATDAARKRAGELGVALDGMRGSGSKGRVLVKDVERAAGRG